MIRRRKSRPSIETLDNVAIEEILRTFEDGYAEATGERITSAAFYDRYLKDDVDDVQDAIRWASYYELLREQGDEALARAGRRQRRSPVAIA
jgi:hypothetical protein